MKKTLIMCPMIHAMTREAAVNERTADRRARNGGSTSVKKYVDTFSHRIDWDEGVNQRDTGAGTGTKTMTRAERKEKGGWRQPHSYPCILALPFIIQCLSFRDVKKVYPDNKKKMRKGKDALLGKIFP
jgi:hypothetical protein